MKIETDVCYSFFDEDENFLETETSPIKKEENFEKEMQKKFDELLTIKDEARKDILINSFCQELKITKGIFKQSFKQYVKKKKEEKRKENAKKFLKKFNENFVLPENFLVTKEGLLTYVQNMKNNEKLIIICEFFVIEKEIIIKNEETKENEVAFIIKTCSNKEFLLFATDAVDSKKIAKVFANNSILLDNNAAKAAVTYIANFKRLNEEEIEKIEGRDSTGWSNNLNTFYLPSLGNNVVWVNKKLLDKFLKKGDINKEIEMLRVLGKGRAFLIPLLALTSSLIKIVDIDMNLVVHLGGLTGTGKTLAIACAYSLYAKPTTQTNWNATQNGIETYLEENKDVPSWIDELESANSYKEVDKIINTIYNFANATGKQRGYISETGKIRARDVKTFRGILFSSGEKLIKDIVDVSKKQRSAPLGLTRRLLDIDAEWLWEGFSEEQKRYLHSLKKENYGNFVEQWIKILQKVGQIKIKEIYKSFEEKFVFLLNGKESYFYLMLTALELLKENKIITEEIYKIQINNILELYQKEKENSDKDKNILQNFLEKLAEFVSINANKFFDKADDESLQQQPQEMWGLKENNYLYLTTHAFEKLCAQEGFIKTQIVSKLLEKNLLLTDKNRKTKNKKVKGITVKFYAIDMSLVENFLNKNEEDIPF